MRRFTEALYNRSRKSRAGNSWERRCTLLALPSPLAKGEDGGEWWGAFIEAVSLRIIGGWWAAFVDINKCEHCVYFGTTGHTCFFFAAFQGLGDFIVPTAFPHEFV